MDIQKKLYWLIGAGITCFCDEKSHDAPRPSKPLQMEDTPATTQARTFAAKAATLESLNTEKQNFTLSALKKTATHTLLGQGPIKPKLMCILDTPDGEADRAGDIWIGAQAEQLKKMMAAIHLDYQKEVYLTSLSPWRTPGNRVLTEAERALFLPFLMQEIQLIRPKGILLFGAILSQTLLRMNTLTKARGTWHSVENIPVRVTLALSTLKTTPLRQQAWLDLQEVEKMLGTL